MDQNILKRCFTCKTENTTAKIVSKQASVSKGKIQLEIMLVINTSVFRKDFVIPVLQTWCSNAQPSLKEVKFPGNKNA